MPAEPTGAGVNADETARLRASYSRDDALHEAIGWLIGAIETEHPGFVLEQARRAKDNPSAAVLADWAARLGQKGRVCVRCKRRWGRAKFIANQRVCFECKYPMVQEAS